MPEASVNEGSRPVGAGPGDLLRQGRERLGMTPERLAEELRLKPVIVRALESNDLDALPEATYVRGYLRAYARRVEVDEAEVLARYEAIRPPPPVVEPAPGEVKRARRTAPGRPLLALLGVLVAIVAGTVWYLSLEQEAQTRATLPGVSLAPPPSSEHEVSSVAPESSPPSASLAGSEPADPAGGETDAGRMPEPEVPAAPTPEPAPLSPVAAEAQGGPSLSLPPSEITQADVTPGTDVLVLRCREASWVEVRDARGKELVYSLVAAGAERRVQGQGPFRVFLGFAPGVEVSVNGEPVPLANRIRADNTARFQTP